MSGGDEARQPGRLLSSLLDRATAAAEASLGRDAHQEGATLAWLPSGIEGAEWKSWLLRNLGLKLRRVAESAAQSPTDDELVDRVKQAVRRTLAQQRDDQRALAPLIAPLLVEPAARRWEQVTSNRALRHPQVVSALLDGAELLEEVGAEAVEELALAALHLAERLPVKSTRRTVIHDLCAQAWLVRVEVGLWRGEREEAAFALEQAQSYQERGSGDPYLVVATGRAAAWLAWLEDDLELAVECFGALAKRAAEIEDRALEAEARVWQALAEVQREQPGAADWARAVTLVGVEEAARIGERVTETAARFSLGPTEEQASK